uniref:Coiled-coil domain containing 14 n=1 Tax=Callorhinchus milii TaxID=7868 RepID=A0A4W3HZA0_CALMI
MLYGRPGLLLYKKIELTFQRAFSKLEMWLTNLVFYQPPLDLKTATLNPGNVTKSKGILSKGESTKRKEFKKNGPVPRTSHVQKQIVSVSEFKVLPGAAEPVVNNNGAELTMLQVAVPSNKHVSVMNQPVSGEVQTQMSLINSQAAKSASNGIPMQSYYAVMESGCQDAPKFNSRLPTSTPALSPQNAGQPLVIQSAMPHDLYNQTSSQGGMNFFPIYTTTAPAIQPVMTFAPSGIPHTSLHTVAMPTLIQPLSGGDGVGTLINYGEQCLKERDPLKCIQHQVTKMQNPEVELQQKAWQTQARVQESSESDEEGCDGTTTEEDDLNSVDITPVRDTSCQTSFDRHLQLKTRSPDKTAKKVRTVKNLLSELKTRVSDKDDSEIIRLIMELDESVSLLPTGVGSTNVQAEIAIGLQSLRSENAQLRRRLRIVNQQLRERERAEKESRITDCNFELISLQCMNTTLQTQLKESQKGLESLQRKNEELLSVIDEQSKGNKQLLQQMQEKEQDLFHNRQQCERDTTRVKMEVDEALAKMRSLQLKLEASEKENQIVGITLRQRDMEVSRLRDLTRTLQCSMARLVSDLSIDCTKAKPETRLTRNLLEEYNHQLEEEPIMDKGINSVAMYLKNLDIDKTCAIRTILQSGERQESEPTVPVQTFTTIPMYSTNNALPKAFGRQLNFPSPTKTVSDGSTLVGEESNLDETTYIPLVGNVSKIQNKLFEQRNCIPPQSSRDSKRFNIDNENSDANLYNRAGAMPSTWELPEKAVDEQLPVLCKLQEIAATDCSSRIFFRATVPENDLIQMKPSDITAVDFTDNASNLPKLNAHQHTSLPHERNGLLLNKSRVSAVDSSFSTFDSRSVKSDWTMSSVSSFSSRDEQAFQNGLAALDANIARLQRSLRTDFLR